MARETKTSLDQIIVSQNDAIFAREVTTVEEDGKVISISYNRLSFIKGCDISFAPEQVKKICNTLWS
jgi:hypothetical protein